MYRFYKYLICSKFRKRKRFTRDLPHSIARFEVIHSTNTFVITPRVDSGTIWTLSIHHLLTTGMLGYYYSLFRVTPNPQSVAKRTASARVVQIYVFQHELAQRSRHSGATTFFVVCDGNAQQTSNTPPNTQVMRSVSKSQLPTSILGSLSSYLYYPKPRYRTVKLLLSYSLVSRKPWYVRDR